MDEPVLTVEHVAKLLELCEYTVREMAKSGTLPAFKVGSRWRFDPDEIRAWIAARRALR